LLFKGYKLQRTSNDLPLYFVPLFPLFFVGLWCLVSAVVSLIGGWLELGRRFRAQSQPYGDAPTAGPFFYSVYMRLRTHYGNVIRMTAAPDGLYLSVLFLFRVAHPPLFIPWDEIAFTRASFLWWRYVILTLGRQEQVPMRISERMARDLRILHRVAASESLV
jgi:hypothetical protein